MAPVTIARILCVQPFGLGPNTVMQARSGLADLSMLPEGGVIPSGNGIRHAACVGTFEDVPKAPRSWLRLWYCFSSGAFQFLCSWKVQYSRV
jgi:hypothetical protein